MGPNEVQRQILLISSGMQLKLLTIRMHIVASYSSCWSLFLLAFTPQLTKCRDMDMKKDTC